MITIEEVERSLRRILIFFFPEPSEQLEYIKAIYEQVSKLCDSGVFDQVCQEVASTMRTGKRPAPCEYLEVIRRLQKETPAKIGCEECGFSGWRSYDDGGNGCAVPCGCNPYKARDCEVSSVSPEDSEKIKEQTMKFFDAKLGEPLTPEQQEDVRDFVTREIRRLAGKKRGERNG